MKRRIDLSEISDGKIYGTESMVKVPCNECEGCSECCRSVGNTIILDPMDAWNLEKAVNAPFETLIGRYADFKVVDGLILPYIITEGGCRFLNKNGRCTIHRYRPGICRLFPLGRIYEDGRISYILQVNECMYKTKTKTKVSKWVDTENLPAYNEYIAAWHAFLDKTEEGIRGLSDEEVKKAWTAVLKSFYLTSYPKENFYDEFYKRLSEFGTL